LLYWLLYQKLFVYIHAFRVFRYLTIRTAFATLTALLIGLLIGPYLIEKLREFQIGQFIREDGPKDHQKKAGTPTLCFQPQPASGAISHPAPAPTRRIADELQSGYPYHPG